MSYYMTLSSQEKHSVHTFTRIQHYFSKYWGDGCMGRPPPQILGDRQPGSPSLHASYLKHIEVRSVELVITEMTEGLIFYLNIHVHTFAAIWGAQWCSSQRSG